MLQFTVLIDFLHDIQSINYFSFYKALTITRIGI